jgi:proton glutamate symport protein
MRKLQLHWQILIAIAAGIAAGWLSGEEGALFGVTFFSVYEFVGTLFINALKMLIVPLIMSSIIVGVAGIGGGGNLGRLGGKTLLFYGLTSTLAILVGLCWSTSCSPASSNGEPARDLLALEPARGQSPRASARPRVPAAADSSRRCSSAWCRRTSSRRRPTARCSA